LRVVTVDLIKTVISPEAGDDEETNRTLGAVCKARAARATAARSIDAATATRTLKFGWRGAAPLKRGVLLAILDLAFQLATVQLVRSPSCKIT